MGKKKNKKIKVVFLKDFETVMMLKRIGHVFEDNKNVPYYKADIDERGNINLNIFKDYDLFNINKVKFVKLTVPTKVLNNIDLTKYKKDKIKIVKPEQKLQNETNMTGIIVPIKIFEGMLLSYVNKPNSLSSLLIATTSTDSIKLLDEDKKFIAYMLLDL